MSSETFKKLNGGSLDDLLSGRKMHMPEPKLVDEPLPVVAVDLTIKPSTDEQKLNKTEKLRLNYLRRLQGSRPVGIQNITLKLGDDCRFTPDFNYIDENGRLVMEDVKGHMEDDALVKLKTAARMYRWMDFVVVRLTKGKTWEVSPVKP